MLFNDEIVKNGKVDRFGQPITGNMERTLHQGIEVSAQLTLNDNFGIFLKCNLQQKYD